jgi:hypothetical protein
MTDCGSITDKMALVAHRRAGWTGEETSHLESCPSCASEWRVVIAAGGLGAAAAQRLDPSRLSNEVLLRLKSGRRWRRAGWIGIVAAAAAIALVVWLDRPMGEPVASVAQEEFHMPLVELDNLDSDLLQAVLDDLEAPLGATAAPEVPVLGDLEDQELERVLRSLEG